MRYNLVLFIVLLGLCGCQSTAEWGISKNGMQGVERISVLIASDPGLNPTTGSIVFTEDQTAVEKELLIKGYMVVDRSRISTTLDELKMQNKDLFSDDGRKQLGQLLGVDAFLYVTVNQKSLRNGVPVTDNVTGQLVAVGDGSILASTRFERDYFTMNWQDHCIPELMANFPEYQEGDPGIKPTPDRVEPPPNKTSKASTPTPTSKAENKMPSDRVEAKKQDTAYLTITSSPEEIYPLQPFTVTLKIWIQALPSPYEARDPLAVQQDPPTLSIPWAVPDLSKAMPGLIPEIDTNKWLGPLVARTIGFERGAGFGINSYASSTIFSQESLRFKLKYKRTKRPVSNGEEKDFREYTLERTFIPQKAGSFIFGPVMLEGHFATTIDRRNNRLSGEDIHATSEAITVQVRDVLTQDQA